MEAERGGFSRGFGRGSRGRGRGRGRGRNTPEDDLKNWVPVTKLGRLVRDGLVSDLETIYYHSLPIKEYQIIDHFFLPGLCAKPLSDEVMKITSVQKQTRAGQRTLFKAFVAVGNSDGYCGLGVKCAKEVATAIRGAIISAKLSLIPIRRGFWGNKIGKAHTVPMKVSGKCGSVRVRLIPAPRGSHIVGAPTTKKILGFAGIADCFTSSTGSTKTKGNFMKALFDALSKTHSYLTPDLWPNSQPMPHLFHDFSSVFAVKEHKLE